MPESPETTVKKPIETNRRKEGSSVLELKNNVSQAVGAALLFCASTTPVNHGEPSLAPFKDTSPPTTLVEKNAQTGDGYSEAELAEILYKNQELMYSSTNAGEIDGETGEKIIDYNGGALTFLSDDYLKELASIKNPYRLDDTLSGVAEVYELDGQSTRINGTEIPPSDFMQVAGLNGTSID